jgi:hypothetical protein
MNGTHDRSTTETREDEGGLALAVALIAVYVLMAALASDGASDGVVYGVYVVTATMLVLGTFGAARSAVREDWHELGLSIAVVLLGNSAAHAWLLRPSRSGA